MIFEATLIYLARGAPELSCADFTACWREHAALLTAPASRVSAIAANSAATSRSCGHLQR